MAKKTKTAVKELYHDLCNQGRRNPGLYLLEILWQYAKYGKSSERKPTHRQYGCGADCRNQDNIAGIRRTQGNPENQTMAIICNQSIKSLRIIRT